MANKRKTRKISKRVLEMQNDPTTVWGKHPKLEKFWRDLASGKKVVVIYKNGTHKYAKSAQEDDPNILAILSSNQSQDAYEVHLYPKAKDKPVEYVIKNYKKYFKPIVAGAKMRVP